MYLLFLVLALSVPISLGADASKTAASPQRMAALPADVSKAILAEESKLNNTLAGWRRAANPGTCRSQTMTAFEKTLSALLDKFQVKPNPRMHGGGGADCFGDTRANAQASCGGAVEKISIPCIHCDLSHVYRTGGKCFIWMCVYQP